MLQVKEHIFREPAVARACTNINCLRATKQTVFFDSQLMCNKSEWTFLFHSQLPEKPTLKTISALAVLAQTIENTKTAQPHNSTTAHRPDEAEGMLMLSFRLARDSLINYVCLCVIGSWPFARFRLVALVYETFIAKTIEFPRVTFRTKQMDEYVKYT
uniref:Uncharacterized protein n=1 Tax=Glossina pallidipes TaxID=7398 RepID=A0A1A9ZBW8_GLOPL